MLLTFIPSQPGINLQEIYCILIVIAHTCPSLRSWSKHVSCAVHQELLQQKPKQEQLWNVKKIRKASHLILMKELVTALTVHCSLCMSLGAIIEENYRVQKM